MMSLDDKIAICKDILANADSGMEADGYALGHFNYNYSNSRVDVFIAVLKKMEVLPLDFVEDENYPMDSIFIYIVDQLTSWEAYSLDPEEIQYYVEEAMEDMADVTGNDLYDFSIEDSYEKDDSELSAKDIYIRNSILSFLRKYYPYMENKKCMNMLDKIIGTIWDNEEFFQINFLENKNLKQMVQDGFIDEALFEFFRCPLILNPEVKPLFFKEDGVCAWLTGYSAYYAEINLTMDSVSFYFLISLLYIDFLYQKEYTGKNVIVGKYVFF